MTDTTIAKSEPVLVAIDISKARHEVLIAVPGKKRRRRLTVLNQLDELLPWNWMSMAMQNIQAA
jgi:hypothetical protein